MRRARDSCISTHFLVNLISIKKQPFLLVSLSSFFPLIAFKIYGDDIPRKVFLRSLFAVRTASSLGVRRFCEHNRHFSPGNCLAFSYMMSGWKCLPLRFSFKREYDTKFLPTTEGNSIQRGFLAIFSKLGHEMGRGKKDISLRYASR